MKHLYLIFFLAFTIKNYSQSKDFSIDFKHINSSIVFSEVEIYIKKRENNISVFVRNGDSASKRYSVSNEDFEKLKTKILSLKSQDVISENQNGWSLDSGTTEIEFGESEYLPRYSAKYTVDNLNSGDEKTSRKDFLNVVKLILELAKLKLEDLK